MGKYSVGIDFGTLSARAVLVELETGNEIAESTFKYPHGVIENDYFEGVTLPKTTALQHPQDYVDALTYTVKELDQIIPILLGVSADEKI